jgi:hypothetical protein
VLGDTGEDEVFQIFQTKYNDIQKTGSKYSIFDFQSKDNKVKVEVKSRRNVHNKYPTTMIGYNKIKKCNNPNTTYLFIFKFTDRIMHIFYDKEVFKGFDLIIILFFVSLVFLNKNKYIQAYVYHNI